MYTGIVVREVPVAEVLDLRWEVLRPGRPRDSARLDGDDDPATVALAAFVVGAGAGPAGAEPAGAGAVPLSTATLMSQPCPWRPGVAARRLRAMATDPAGRGLGLGSAVLAEAVRRASSAGAEVLWCHAREAAVAFYARAGFTVEGAPFDVPCIGRHRSMSLQLR